MHNSVQPAEILLDSAPGSPLLPPRRSIECQRLLSRQESEWLEKNDQRALPLKALCLAGLLFFFGLVFIGVACLILGGFFRVKDMDKATPYGLLIFGLLCVVPGGFHLVSGLLVAFGRRGYSWDDIPNFSR